MAILELIAIWFVISVVVSVLLGMAINRMGDASHLSNRGRKRKVRRFHRLHLRYHA